MDSQKVYRYSYHIGATELSTRKDPNPFEWAVVLFDNYGTLAIVSDYEDGACKLAWKPSEAEPDFRYFMRRASPNYLSRKLFRELIEQPDYKATKAAVAKAILEDRREKGRFKQFGFDKATARYEYSLLDDCVTVAEWLERTDIPDASEFIVTGSTAQIIDMEEFVWPKIQELIKADIDKNP